MDLSLQLARAPAGISGIALELTVLQVAQPRERVPRRTEVQALDQLVTLRIVEVSAVQDQSVLGLDRAAAADELPVVTSAILVAGFAVRGLSAFLRNEVMGLMMSITILCALLADFLLLPPLLIAIDAGKGRLLPALDQHGEAGRAGGDLGN